MKSSISRSQGSDAHDTRPSGRFVLRLDSSLHAALKREAAHQQCSLNEYCVRVLATQGAAGDPDAAGVVAEVRRLAGTALVGVVAYGSWARGEPSDASDVDLLVVLDARVELTRALYRTWDATPLKWATRDVDLHLVHPIEPAQELSGTWAEAATDGIVLCDRGFELSRQLVCARQRIAAGELVRRVAHGQPYWVQGLPHA
jgi:predicted nucleotidyltransferase